MLALLQFLLSLLRRLFGCGAGGGSGGGSGGGGSGGGSGGGPTPNPPTVVLLGPEGKARGVHPRELWGAPVPLRYRLIDPQGLDCTLRAEYQLPGTPWRPCTEALGVGSHGVAQLSASAAGELHVFAWDAGTDLNLPAIDVKVRISADNGAASVADESEHFTVIATLVGMRIRSGPIPPPQIPSSQTKVVLFAPTGTPRGTVVRLPIVVRNSESARVDLQPEFDSGSGAFQPMSLAPESDRPTGLPAPDFEADYRLLWDAAADLGATSQRVMLRLTPVVDGVQTGPASEASVDVDPRPGPAPATFVAPTPAGPVSISAIAGDGQTGVSGRLLPEPLVARVRDPAVNAVRGARVTFVKQPPNLDVELLGDPDLWQTSDRYGKAAIRVRLGDNFVGAGAVEARVVGSPAAVARWDFSTNAPQIVEVSPPAGQLEYGRSYRIEIAYDGDNDPATVDFAAEPARPVELELQASGVLVSQTLLHVGATASNRATFEVVPTILDGQASVVITERGRPAVTLTLTWTVATSTNAIRRVGGAQVVDIPVRMYARPIAGSLDQLVGYQGLTLMRDLQVEITDSTTPAQVYTEQVTANPSGCIPGPTVETLKLTYRASGGVLSTTPTAGTQFELTVDAGTPIHFTPTQAPPWRVDVSAGPQIADPLRRPYSWINSSGGQECRQQSTIGDVIHLSYLIAPPSRVHLADGTAPQLGALEPGDRRRLIIEGLSPVSGGAPEDLELASLLAHGEPPPVPYTGLPVPLTQRVAVQVVGPDRLQTGEILFTRGAPQIAAASPVVHGALVNGHVQFTGSGIAYRWRFASETTARTLLDGAESPYEATSGVSPRDGADASVLAHNGEFVLGRSDLTIRTRTQPLTFTRVFRAHRRGTGVLGPGWVWQHEEHLDVSRWDGVRLHTGAGTHEDFKGNQPPPGVLLELTSHMTISPDASPYELEGPHGDTTHYHVDGSLRMTRDRLGNTQRYVWDERARLVEIVDVHGRTVRMTYWEPGDPVDAEVYGRLRRIEDMFGRKVEFDYYGRNDPDGPPGALRRVTGPAARTLVGGQPDANHRRTETYVYAPGGASDQVTLLKIIDDTHSTRLENRYTHEGRIVEQDFGVDAQGNPLTYHHRWDPSARIMTVIDPAQNERSYAFQTLSPFPDAAISTTIARIPNPASGATEPPTLEVVQANHDGFVVYEASAAPDREEWFYVYDPSSTDALDRGNLLAKRHRPVGGTERVWHYEYTNRHRLLTKVVGPEGTATGEVLDRCATSYIYDLQLPSSDPQYGQRGVLVRVAYPRTMCAVMAPTATGHRHLWIDENPTERLRYNGYGQVVEWSDVQGVTKTFAYYPDADPTGASSSVAAGGGGLLAEVIEDADPGPGRARDNRQLHLPSQPFIPRSRTLEYDVRGFAAALVDARGVRFTFDVSPIGEVYRVVHATAAPAPLRALALTKRIEHDWSGRVVSSAIEQPSASAEAGGPELVERWHRDALGRVSTHSRTIAAGRSVDATFARDAIGRVTAIRPPEVTSGRFPRAKLAVTLDKNGDIRQLDQGEGAQAVETRIDWDTTGRIAEIMGPDGARETYARDAFGDRSTTIDPGANVTRVIRGLDGAPGRIVAQHGDRNTTRSSTPSPATAPYAIATELRVNELGRVNRVHRMRFVPARTGTTTSGPAPSIPMAPVPDAAEHFPDDPSWPTSLPLGDDGPWGAGDGRATHDLTHDAWGMPTREADDELGFAWTIRNAHGEPVEAHIAFGDRVERASYDAGGNRVGLELELRQTHRFGLPVARTITVPSKAEFDAVGRPTRRIDGAGNAKEVEYDELGFVRHAWDAMGPDTTEQFNGAVVNGRGNKTTYARDGLGRITRVESELRVDGRGDNPLDVHAYNATGKSTLTFEHDEGGRLLAWTDSAGNRTAWRFDPGLGRPTHMIAPGSTASGGHNVETELIYDGNGRVHRTIDANGTELGYTYDPSVSRVTQVDVRSHGTGVLGTAGLSFDYDSSRERATDLSSTHFVERTTNSEGRLAWEVAGIPGAETLVEWDYDSAGRLTALRSPGGETRLIRDRAGRLTEITDGGRQIVRFEHLGVERVAARLHGSLRVELDYADHTGWLEDLRASGPSGTIAFHVARDRMGRITSRTRSFAGSTETDLFAYDSLGRITKHERRTGGTSVTVERLFDGDGVVRERTTRDASGTTIVQQTREERGRIVSRGGQRLTYDRHGNLIDDGRQTYAYDAFNRLVRVARSGGPTIDYTYDAHHRLVSKTAGGVVETYVYEGWQLLEVRVGGVTTERFIYADGLDALVEFRVGVERYTPIVGPDGWIDAIADENGDLVERYRYDLDGAVEVLDPSGNPTGTRPRSRMLFHGRPYDPDTELYNMRSRWLHPGLGQYLSPDPSGVDAGANHYAFAHHDPVNSRDPSGLSDGWSWGTVLGIGAAVVVGIGITVLTGGAAAAVLGPTLGAIAVGALAGGVGAVAGEVVESLVDGEEITASKLASAAVTGAALGGIFSGLGRAASVALRSAAGRQLAERVLTWDLGQRAVAAVYHLRAQSWNHIVEHYAPRAAGAIGAIGAAIPGFVRSATARMSGGVGALSRATGAAGQTMTDAGISLAQGLSRAPLVGGFFGRNATLAAAQRFAERASANIAPGTGQVWAATQGTLADDGFTALTQAGRNSPMVTTLADASRIARLEEPAMLELAEQVGLVPAAVRRVGQLGAAANLRLFDAEFKLFTHLLRQTPDDVTGVLFIGPSQVMCPSCFTNLWRTLARRPGLSLFNARPPVSLAGAGGAGTATLATDE